MDEKRTDLDVWIVGFFFVHAIVRTLIEPRTASQLADIVLFGIVVSILVMWISVEGLNRLDKARDKFVHEVTTKTTDFIKEQEAFTIKILEKTQELVERVKQLSRYIQEKGLEVPPEKQKVMD